MQFQNILILVGTIWPVVGFFLAILVGLLFSGWLRWVMLLIGPIVFLLPCIIFAKQIAYNGNMLFVALFGVAFIFACVYYPIVGIVGIVVLIKQKHSDE
jgi:hypothetical protein